MPQYLSPGVYVEEVPSAIQAIAGVSTSTAGFIGKASDVIVIPPGPLNRVTGEAITGVTATNLTYTVAAFPVREAGFVVTDSWTDANEQDPTKKAKQQPVTGATLKNNFATGTAVLTFPTGFTLSTGHTLTVDYDTFSIPVKAEAIGKGDASNTIFRLASYPVRTDVSTIRVDGTAAAAGTVTLSNDFSKRVSYVTFTTAPAQDKAIAGDYFALPTNLVVHKEKVGLGNASATTFPLAAYPAWVGAGLFAIYTGTTDDYTKATVATGATITVDDVNQVAQVVFTSPPASNTTIWANYIVQPTFRPLKKQVKLCTSFSEYRKYFGDFSADPDHNILTHAVYGFFHNGGSRCYVGVIDSDAKISMASWTSSRPSTRLRSSPVRACLTILSVTRS